MALLPEQIAEVRVKVDLYKADPDTEELTDMDKSMCEFIVETDNEIIKAEEIVAYTTEEITTYQQMLVNAEAEVTTKKVKLHIFLRSMFRAPPEAVEE